jgi:hypothetical protein
MEDEIRCIYSIAKILMTLPLSQDLAKTFEKSHSSTGAGL